MQAETVEIWRGFRWSKDPKRVQNKDLTNIIHLDFWQNKSGLVWMWVAGHFSTAQLGQ